MELHNESTDKNVCCEKNGDCGMELLIGATSKNESSSACCGQSGDCGLAD